MRLKPKPGILKEKDYSQYPFQNFSLTSMDGEQWKDIPQLDGLFCVSNYGRIWAAARQIVSITGQTYHTKERIRKQSMTNVYSSYCDTPLEQLSLNLRYGGKSHGFKVNRLVYDLFVERINSENDNLLVIHKDGDNCNNRWDNLALMNGTELYGHRLSLNRMPRTGQIFQRADSFLSDKNAPRKVIQYSLDGVKLNEYKSLAEAARTNNIDRTSLRLVAQQKLIQLHGMVYRFEGTAYQGEHASFSYAKKVTQYTLDGKKIESFLSVKEAAIQISGDASAISKCALGKLRTYRGSVWRYDGVSYDRSYEINIKNRPLPMIQFHLDGTKLASFESANEAGRLTGFSVATLLDCARKKSKVSHGYVWRFKGDHYSGEFNGFQRGKPVTQYNLAGIRMTSYATIAAAALATGLTSANIEKNVHGHNKTAGGFIWKFASQQEANMIAFVAVKNENSADRKEVVQYSPDGQKQTTFPSISSAAKACNVSAGGISEVLDKPSRTAGGFVWRTKGNAKDALDPLKPPTNQARAVTQYDLKGNKLNVYSSTKEANRITGVPSSTISSVARGRLKSTGGFIWLYGNCPKKINIEEHFASCETYMKSISKPVLKFSLAGEFIKEYPSIQAAGRDEGIRSATISAAINGQTRSAGGNLWKLKISID